MTTQAATGAMAGLRVIDLSRVLGGPYCTQILADHGADIVKVEPPAGDETRDWGPPFHDDDAAYFIGTNRNKRSIGLDLASEGGREVLMHMLKDADVLIENFKPGTLDKWGIGNDFLRAKFPRLIHCRISGFGGDGPHGGHPGYDAIIQSMVGIMASTGSPESGPTRVGVALVDMTTGLYACVGILMALAERQKSGLGQFVEATLFETGLAIMHPHTANFFMHGKPPALTGNEHPNLVPYAVFAARDGNIFMGVGNDATFRKLCRELGKPELGTDPRFARNRDRIEHRDALRAELEAILKEHDSEPLCRKLLAAGLPAGPVQSIDKTLASEHVKHRGDIIEKDWYKGIASPIRFDRTKASLRMVPPTYSQHAEEILEEFGYSADEIAGLRAKGVVCGPERKR
ncbi:CaiB/BaiF CoA transferase family protein [Afipia sp. TerB]